MKKYFPDESYNKIPCGIVVFNDNESLGLVYANESYYSDYSNGNSESLNITQSNTDFVAKIREKLSDSSNAEIIYNAYRNGNEIMNICMSVSRLDENNFIGAMWDVTMQHEMLKKLERYEIILGSLNNIIFGADILQNKLTLYIPQHDNHKIIQPQESEGIDRFLENAVHPSEYNRFIDNFYNGKEENIVVKMKIVDDDWQWYRIHRQFEYNAQGQIVRIFGIMRNIESEKKQEKQLKQKIELDPVLKVYNRNAAVERTNKYLSENKDRRDYALMVMDIDNFKTINDTCGHLYGDAVIAMVARTLKNIFGDNNVVGRYGGDEFFVFLTESTTEEICEKADRIINDINNFRTSNDQQVTCSIGIALGTDFEAVPDYKAMFEKADRALYSVKNSGKMHWEIYDINQMTGQVDHRAIDYEEEDRENTELLESRDLMKVFLELSAGTKTSDEAIYKIMKYIMERFDFDCMQIMQVNGKDDLITVKYEWCNDPNFRNSAGKSGYYVHSDIKMFSEHFKRDPIFMVSPETATGFSPKFQKEFDKNMRYSVIYNANTTRDDLFYMFVCTRFDKNHIWNEKECQELNIATKIMTMYVSQSDRETETERKLAHQVAHDRKTNLYSVMEFYVQLGRLRKLAKENDEDVALMHVDIGNFLNFNRKFGVIAGDEVLMDYAEHIKSCTDVDYNISAHIDGTDIYFIARRIPKGDKSFIETIDKEAKEFCVAENAKYPGAHLIIRTGIYLIEGNEEGGYGFDSALIAKRTVKDCNESYTIVYDKSME